MLDFGFSEIVLTSAIALIVLGPEKLPKVARQVGNWMGRARAMARQLTEQLEREVDADDLLKQTRRTRAAQAGTAPAVAPLAGVAPAGSARADVETSALNNVSSAPVAFDTSYTPPAPTPPASMPAADMSAPSAAPAAPPDNPLQAAALPSAADWLPTPRDKKSSDG